MADVLDVCCGPRSMYFDPRDARVLFGDCRDETIVVTDRSRRNVSGVRALHIHPDVLLDFRQLPFDAESFPLVVFDPPHLVQAGPRSWLAARYGKLGTHWQDDLRAGFSECFRVLSQNGTLVFKWNETQIPVRDVLACTTERPLFGHRSGRRSLTHWLTFFKAAASESAAHARD